MINPRRMIWAGHVGRMGEGGLLIAFMMAAVSTFETLVNCYQTTWRNISEDSHLLILYSSFFTFLDRVRENEVLN
jgi:hypothetical protein